MQNLHASSLRGSKPQHGSLNLAEKRARSGVELSQIAESTKISLRFLEAIEHEEFDRLPGGIFARSYVRQYAQAIGCDPAELLEAAAMRFSAAGEGCGCWNTRSIGESA